MKRIFLIAGGVLALLLIAAGVLPYLIPNEVYQRQIERAATDALGREVTLEGDVGLSIFPRLSARIDGVKVANPEGFSRENMIEAGELRGVVKWGPLIGGKVEVAEIAFVDADVMLERRADGESNWTFGTGEPAPEPEEDGGSGGSVNAGVDRASLQNARLVYSDAVADAYYEISELDLTATARAMDVPMEAEAEGLFQGTPFSIDLTLDTPEALMGAAPAMVSFALDTEGGAAGYDGSATMGDVITLDGRFTLDGRDLENLATLAGVTDLPVNLAALGRVRAEGTVAGALETLEIAFEQLSLQSDGLSAGYDGRINLGDVPALAGTVDLDSSDLGAWLGGLGLDLPPAASALKRVELSSVLEGPVDALRLSDAHVSQQGPLLNARFDGSARLGETSSLGGTVAASSTKLRELMDLLEVEMAEGDTLQRFSVEGDVSGTMELIQISKLDASLDDVRAAGALDLRLDGPRPFIGGTITTGRLDLSPFLTTSDAPPPESSGSTGWSDEKLDLSGLQAVDADIQLKADQIILGDIALDQPDLAATVANGNLTADITSMRAFGGAWAGEFGLDGSAATPAMRANLTGQSIAVDQALGALAGIDALAGLGELNVDVTSRGDSLKALVEGLSGEMGSNLQNGVIKGINIGQLVRSRDNIVQALADGTLQMALEPEAETDFTSLLAGLDISNGVASISQFSMTNPVLSLSGDGSINLGAQTMDVGIVPRVDTSGSGAGSALQLNGVPIPFRIQGSWTSPRLTPDTNLIQSILRQDVGNRIGQEIGGDAGNIIGQIIGGGQGQSSGSSSGQTPATPSGEGTTEGETTTPPARTPEEQLEDAARDAARNAIGDLFNRNRQQQQPAEEEAETEGDGE